MSFAETETPQLAYDSFEHLFCRMIALEPADRPTAEECLEHGWLQTGVADYVTVQQYM